MKHLLILVLSLTLGACATMTPVAPFALVIDDGLAEAPTSQWRDFRGQASAEIVLALAQPVEGEKPIGHFHVQVILTARGERKLECARVDYASDDSDRRGVQTAVQALKRVCDSFTFDEATFSQLKKAPELRFSITFRNTPDPPAPRSASIGGCSGGSFAFETPFSLGSPANL